MAGELAAEWIKIPDGNGNLQKVWVRDSTARRDIAQLQTDVSGKADAATTLAGYGITDAYTKTQVDGMIPSVPSAYTSNPEMDGTASPGSSTAWARGDHIHPHDSTKADASAIPTPSSTAPAMDGTAAAGSSDDYARADHVHPSDTTKQDALTTTQLAAVDSGINASIVGNFTPTQVGTTYTSNTYVSSSSFNRITVYRVAPNLCIMYASFALSAAYTGTTTTIGKINGFTEIVMVLQNVAGGAGNEMAVYITGGQIRLLNGAGASGEWFRFVIPLVGTFT